MGHGLGRQVVGLTLCVVGVAGCGGGGGSSSDVGAGTDRVVERPTTSSTTTALPTSTEVPDQFASATAGGLLLTAADLGPGWAAAAPATPTTCAGNPIDEDPLVFASPPDAAQATFADAGARIVQTVALQTDRRAAQTAIDGWVYRMELCERMGGDSGIDYAIDMGPASLGTYGEQSWTSRLTVAAQGQAFDGFEVVYRQGRAVVHVNVVGAPASVPLERAKELMGLVTAKVARG